MQTEKHTRNVVGGKFALGIFVLFACASFLLYKWDACLGLCRVDSHAYDSIIGLAAKKHGVPPELVKAVIWRESNFNPKCRGKAGEIGLMQIMQGAVTDWKNGTKNSRNYSDWELFDPELNIEIGTWYLGWTGRHWEKYASKDILQLAEYNAGYGNVSRKWKPANPATPISLEDITYPGTKEYVKKILAQAPKYKKDFMPPKQ